MTNKFSHLLKSSTWLRVNRKGVAFPTIGAMLCLSVQNLGAHSKLMDLIEGTYVEGDVSINYSSSLGNKPRFGYSFEGFFDLVSTEVEGYTAETGLYFATSGRGGGGGKDTHDTVQGSSIFRNYTNTFGLTSLQISKKFEEVPISIKAGYLKMLTPFTNWRSDRGVGIGGNYNGSSTSVSFAWFDSWMTDGLFGMSKYNYGTVTEKDGTLKKMQKAAGLGNDLVVFGLSGKIGETGIGYKVNLARVQLLMEYMASIEGDYSIPVSENGSVKFTAKLANTMMNKRMNFLTSSESLKSYSCIECDEKHQKRESEDRKVLNNIPYKDFAIHRGSYEVGVSYFHSLKDAGLSASVSLSHSGAFLDSGGTSLANAFTVPSSLKGSRSNSVSLAANVRYDRLGVGAKISALSSNNYGWSAPGMPSKITDDFKTKNANKKGKSAGAVRDDLYKITTANASCDLSYKLSSKANVRATITGNITGPLDPSLKVSLKYDF